MMSMKRLILMVVAVAVAAVASAQSVVTVDSEKIFKSIAAYNEALAKIDQLGKEYQAQVDAKFAEVEALYNDYVNNQRAYLSESGRAAREQEILAKEAEATKFQESKFGQSGELMQKRVELIKPIQERVFAAIDSYAKSNNIDLVVDRAANTTLLYESATIDRTEQIINMLK